MRMRTEALEPRLALACSYDPGLTALISTGGDDAEFVFDSPSPVVEMYCNGGFVAAVNANDFFFSDFGNGTSTLTVDDRAHVGPNSYSVTGNGTTAPAGRVNLLSIGRSVMYQAVNHVTLKTGLGDSNTGIYPGNSNLDNQTFPRVTLSTFFGQNRVAIDDSGYGSGDLYAIKDDRLSTNRLGDKIFFPNSTPENPMLVSLFTGNGSDTILLQGANLRLRDLPRINQLITAGGYDTLRLVDSNSSTGIPHNYQFTESRAIVDGQNFVLFDSTLEDVYVSTGNSDDSFIVGNTSNRLDNIPKIVLASVGTGFNLLTVNDFGYSGGENYRIWEDHLSVSRLSDRVYFPASPENNPLLQVNLNSGSGTDNISVSSSSGRLSRMPYVGVNAGSGVDVLTLNDASADLGLRDYIFTQFAGYDNSRPNRTFYDGSVESVVLDVNDSASNFVTLGSTINSLDGIPPVNVTGRVENLGLLDWGYGGGETYHFRENRIQSNRRGEVVRFESATQVGVHSGSGNDTVVVSNTGLELTNLPDVNFLGDLGSDQIVFDDSGYGGGEIYRLTDNALYIFGGSTLAGSFADDVESIRLKTGAGDDVVNILATSNVATIREYIVEGGSGTKYINIDDSQSSAVAGPAIASTGPGDGFAFIGANEFGDLTKSVSFDHTSVVNFYKAVGSSVDLTNYHPADYVLNILEGATHGDFNDDGRWNTTDLDTLVERIATGGAQESEPFDLNLDGFVNAGDIAQWLVEGGNINLGAGRFYRMGDANLDGVVDGSDFAIWNSNKFTQAPMWSAGDFNADGFVDGSDFAIWNANKFTSSDGNRPPGLRYGSWTDSNEHKQPSITAEMNDKRMAWPSASIVKLYSKALSSKPGRASAFDSVFATDVDSLLMKNPQN